MANKRLQSKMFREKCNGFCSFTLSLGKFESLGAELRLQQVLQSGEEPTWPLKVSLVELPLALSAAHDFGKEAWIM